MAKYLRIFVMLILLATICDAMFGKDYLGLMRTARTWHQDRQIDDRAEQASEALERMSAKERAKTTIQYALVARAISGDGLGMPTRLDELVPQYLKEVPLNPETGKPFYYQRIDSSGYKLED